MSGKLRHFFLVDISDGVMVRGSHTRELLLELLNNLGHKVPATPIPLKGHRQEVPLLSGVLNPNHLCSEIKILLGVKG